MNPGDVTHKAAVDWIAFEIRLSKRSNFMAVQDELRTALDLPAHRKPYVEALDEVEGENHRAASVFRFRIQDPRNAAQLDHVMSALHKRFAIADVRIIGMEIAFDTYQSGASVRELAEIVVDRYRFLTTPPVNKWYLYRKKGEGRRYIENDSDYSPIGTRRDLVTHFAEGWQLTDCDSKGVPSRVHAYVKMFDGVYGKDEAPDPLDPVEYRARIERTLQDDQLPCKTLDDLIRFDFTKLAEHFKFRRLDDTIHPAAKWALTTGATFQLGKKGKYRRPNRKKVGTYSGTSFYRGSTIADDKLNSATYESLRTLTLNWRSRRARADFPGCFERGTLVAQGNA